MKDGQLYEFNILSLIIFETLKELEENGKKNILIIDDLDRIDPNHIFRLFNVFAAHFDHRDKLTENKFGFDHIILVCDIKNIKHIYQHNYGVSTDFNGYVDKFFSREIFYFDNYDNIVSFLESFYDQIKFIGNDKKHTEYLEKDDFLKSKFIFVFTNLIFNKKINLRSLIKNFQKEVKLNRLLIKGRYGKNIKDSQYSLFPFIRILNSFFVDATALKSAIEYCSMSNHLSSFDTNGINILFGELIIALDVIENDIQFSTDSMTITYTSLDGIYNIKYRPYQERVLPIFSAELITFSKDMSKDQIDKRELEFSSYTGKKPTISDYFRLLKKMIEILIDRNYLE